MLFVALIIGMLSFLIAIFLPHISALFFDIAMTGI